MLESYPSKRFGRRIWSSISDKLHTKLQTFRRSKNTLNSRVTHFRKMEAQFVETMSQLNGKSPRSFEKLNQKTNELINTEILRRYQQTQLRPSLIFTANQN